MTRLLLDLLKNLRNRGQNPLDDDLDPLGLRMQAVGLVELRVARDAVKKEWIERNVAGFGQSWIDRVERAIILGAKVGRGAHAGDEGRQMGGLGFVQNRGERRSRRLGLEAAQHVVGAELDDQRVGVSRNRPVVPLKPVGGRVAGNAGIEHLDVPTLGAKRRLQAIRKGLAGRQTETSGQAVSQGDEADRPGGCVRSRGHSRRERERLDEQAPMPI